MKSRLFACLPVLPVLLVGCASVQSGGDAPAGLASGGKAYAAGYEQGQQDTVKRLYWIQERSHLPDATSAPAMELYPVQIPAHEEDGVLVQPSTRVISILK